MAETRIELSGWKAISVLALILAVTGFQVHSRFRSVSEDGREALRQWLVREYEGRGPKALAKLAADYRAAVRVDPEPLPAVEPKVEFVSVSAHGWEDTMVVRTQVTVDGGPPPDDRPVRYLFLTTKPGGGWMVFGESDSFQYYRVLLPLKGNSRDSSLR